MPVPGTPPCVLSQLFLNQVARRPQETALKTHLEASRRRNVSAATPVKAIIKALVLVRTAESLLYFATAKKSKFQNTTAV